MWTIKFWKNTHTHSRHTHTPTHKCHDKNHEKAQRRANTRWCVPTLRILEMECVFVAALRVTTTEMSPGDSWCMLFHIQGTLSLTEIIVSSMVCLRASALALHAYSPLFGRYVRDMPLVSGYPNGYPESASRIVSDRDGRNGAIYIATLKKDLEPDTTGVTPTYIFFNLYIVWIHMYNWSIINLTFSGTLPCPTRTERSSWCNWKFQ